MVDKQIHGWKINPYVKALAGGLMLAAFFLLFAPLYGEGYESARMLANDTPTRILPSAAWLRDVPQNLLLLVFTGCILILKPVTAVRAGTLRQHSATGDPPPAGRHPAIDTPMTRVMREFDRTRASFLPVIDTERRFVGFVSRTRLFEQYRSQVAQQRDIYDDE